MVIVFDMFVVVWWVVMDLLVCCEYGCVEFFCKLCQCGVFVELIDFVFDCLVEEGLFDEFCYFESFIVSCVCSGYGLLCICEELV